MIEFQRVVEWFALVTCLVMGLSHLLQPRVWVEAYAVLHQLGRPGALINGGLSLVPGALFVAAHPAFSGPGIVLTVFGWLLVLKGAICLLAPSLALKSIGKAATGTGRDFVIGGLFLLEVAAAVGYSLLSSRA